MTSVAQKPCPICKKSVVDEAYHPFCSRRCADVDLNRWFTGAYAVPAAEPDEAATDGSEGDD